MDTQTTDTQTGRQSGNQRRVRMRLLFLSVSTAALFAGVFFFVPLGDTLSRVRRLHIETIVAALALSTIFNAVVYADRWRMALRALGFRAPLDTVIRVFVATGPLRLLLPHQTGELATGAALAAQSGFPVGKTISTLIYNKYLSLMATFTLLAIGVVAGAPAHLRFLQLTAAATILVLTGFFVLETAGGRGVIHNLAERFAPSLGRMTRSLLAAFADLPFGVKIKLLAYTFVFQLSEVLVCYLLFRDLGIELPVVQLLAYVQLMILATALPISIAGTGTREAVALLLLAPIAGPEAAVAAGLAYSFFEYLWPLVLGLPLTSSVALETWNTTERKLNPEND